MHPLGSVIREECHPRPPPCREGPPWGLKRGGGRVEVSPQRRSSEAHLATAEAPAPHTDLLSGSPGLPRGVSWRRVRPTARMAVVTAVDVGPQHLLPQCPSRTPFFRSSPQQVTCCDPILLSSGHHPAQAGPAALGDDEEHRSPPPCRRGVRHLQLLLCVRVFTPAWPVRSPAAGEEGLPPSGRPAQAHGLRPTALSPSLPFCRAHTLRDTRQLCRLWLCSPHLCSGAYIPTPARHLRNLRHLCRGRPGPTEHLAACRVRASRAQTSI